MKKEFSFYEFVGILVPGTILLVGIHLIIAKAQNIQIIDFGKIGETTVFIVVCYGFGHILQGVGNIFENIVWFVYGGMPTKWLVKKKQIQVAFIQR